MATPPPPAQPDESANLPPAQKQSFLPPISLKVNASAVVADISQSSSSSSPPPPSSTSTSPPPPTSPPPSPTSPPPNADASPPPPSPSSPPPKAPTPPPPVASSPPPPSDKSSPPPPVASLSPPPPVVSPPPPSIVPPPLPIESPPPPDATPSEASPPPPLSSPPPPSPLFVTPPAPPGPQPEFPPPPPPPQTVPPPESVIQTPPPPQLPLPPSPPSNSFSGGNPLIPSPDSPTFSGGDRVQHTATVAAGVAAGFLLFSLIGLAIWCVCCVKREKRKNSRHLRGGYVMPSVFGSSDDLFHMNTPSPIPLLGSRSNRANSPSEPNGFMNSRSWFTYQELEAITDGFAPHNILGEGGFGAVYKGCLADGREVAVKQLKVGSGQGEREFRAEVEIISRVHHRHLVSLVGYCISDNQRMLVYDYVPNNNLHYHLHDEGRPVLDWGTRSRVAAGAARGIAYLHEDCLPRIIHRDIKSSNILLDKNFEAQVSDFGLARLASDSYTHVTTRVMGTFGYMAPEYARSGKLTEKSDVFSFGVVLLELITGRKPVDTTQPVGEESLVEWARPLLSRALDSEKFDGLVDPRLEKNYAEAEMFRMIEAAAACVRHSASKRPRMGQVMIALDSLGYAKDLSNGMTPGESKIYNSAEQSAEIRLFNRMAFGSQDLDSEIFSDGS